MKKPIIQNQPTTAVGVRITQKHKNKQRTLVTMFHIFKN